MEKLQGTASVTQFIDKREAVFGKQYYRVRAV